jgi:hypothetical protein
MSETAQRKSGNRRTENRPLVVVGAGGYGMVAALAALAYDRFASQSDATE